jgi:hypothetical protein
MAAGAEAVRGPDQRAGAPIEFDGRYWRVGGFELLGPGGGMRFFSRRQPPIDFGNLGILFYFGQRAIQRRTVAFVDEKFKILFSGRGGHEECPVSECNQSLL